jgi:hypothetical protein
MTDEELKGLFETMQRETRGELVAVRQEMGAVRQEVGTGFADVRQEMAANVAGLRQEMGAGFAGVQQEMAANVAGLRQEMSTGFAAVRQEMDARFASVQQDFAGVRHEFADVRQEMRNGFEAVRQENAAEHIETQRHIDVMIQRVDHRLEFVAEGVVAVDQKLDRRCDALGEQVDNGIAETQAMIKFSHTELERRFGSTT